MRHARVTLLTCVLLTIGPFALPGCASLFPLHDEKVYAILPDSVGVSDAAGTSLPVVHDRFDDHFITLHSPENDILFVQYRDAYYQVKVDRTLRFLTLLDLYPMGLGAFIDDLTGNSYGYSSLTLSAIDTLRVHSPGDTLFLQPPAASRFYLLATANYGGFYSFTQTPILTTPRSQAGAGIGFRKALELYAEYGWTALMQLRNSTTNAPFEGNMNAWGVVMRVYPYRGFYATLGYEWIRATSGEYVLNAHGGASGAQDSTVQSGVSHVQAVRAGVGFASSWTFIEYEWSFGLPNQLTFGSQPVQFGFGVLKCGVNVRIP